MPNKNKILGNLALAGFDDIFSGKDNDTSGECIVEIPLTELSPPEFHPFEVKDDFAMERLVKSIKQYGVREPGIARPKEQGYELIAGNRRKRACEIAGIATMPVIIRNLDDDSAAIAMVDSNLEQREKLLYSEKAWAYRVKLEALNHRGAKSEVPGQLSVDLLCEQTGESKNQIYRLVRLTELVITLLDKVDARQLAFNPAVELSYLSLSEQTAVASAMEKYDVKPSLSQAVKLKKLKLENKLTTDDIDSIISENKKEPKLKANEFGRFFPKDYSAKQINAVITKLLTEWQSNQNKI